MGTGCVAGALRRERLWFLDDVHDMPLEHFENLKNESDCIDLGIETEHSELAAGAEQ